jgi:cyclohexanone monooxygenase
LRYANHVADRFGLRDGIRLNTRMTGAVFDEISNRWTAQCQNGEQWSARFLVMASGPLSSPNTPAFTGLDAFHGPVYHTARWPHEAVDFTGLRVAVVGTGSSAIQAIPVIAQQASELTVFQRTAAYCVPAHNGPLDPALEASIKADYPNFRARNRRMHGGFSALLPPNNVSALSAAPQELEAAFEARWRVGGFALLGAFNDLLLSETSNTLAAEFVRKKIRATVHDPETARLVASGSTPRSKIRFTATGRAQNTSSTFQIQFGSNAKFTNEQQRIVCVSLGGRARIAGDGTASCETGNI